MKSNFAQVALFGKYQTLAPGAAGTTSRNALLDIAQFLHTMGCEVVIETETAGNMSIAGYAVMDVPGIGRHCDLGLVVGGDGTMLGIGRQLAPYNVPLIGINQGRLGFITDIRFNNFATALAPMLRGEYEEDHRNLMQARVMRDGHCVFDAMAMNDVVVNRGATSGMVELRVEVDGHFVSNQRADGLIIATPTGSSAYALSAGGPLLHPSIAGWVLVPIAPHTLSNRPIVIANSSEIAIEIVAGRDASASFDMQSLASLLHGDRIVVTRSQHHVRFLHPKGWTYFDTLRQKLHWNEGGGLTVSLKRIVLRDFVIVQELDLDLSGGFTVLTGETGAGKSILIDALQLATGGRADVGVIREGTARADISVEFDMSPAVVGWLATAGFDRGDELLLRRTVDAQGKSRAWINGSPATAAQLREVGEQLLDIHGQHAWQSLIRPDAVRGLLDGYAQVNTTTLSALWQQWRQTQATLDQAHSAQESLQRERERLTWQIGELDKLAPQASEWAHLNTEHGRLSNAQALLDAAQDALNDLDREDGGTLSALNSASQALQSQAHLEPEFVSLSELLASSLAQVEDAAHSLRTYLRRTEPDPQHLAELDTRMSQWLSLARRYKRAPEELPALLASWRGDLAQLDAAADLAGLSQAEQSAQAAYRKEARSISRARHKAAPALAKTVTQAMQGLGMQGGLFEVSLQEAPQACQHGLEDVEFLVAGHVGSSARPIGKVASGGELSRIALAIAVTTSQLGQAQTLIFDEVDAGVGGAVAETVGRLMKQLGGDRQVLAVTHLPQVAACADHHLVVTKQLRGASTVSSIHTVSGEHRVAEIARMLGGEHLSGTTLAHAKEMLRAKQTP